MHCYQGSFQISPINNFINIYLRSHIFEQFVDWEEPGIPLTVQTAFAIKKKVITKRTGYSVV